MMKRFRQRFFTDDIFLVQNLKQGVKFFPWIGGFVPNMCTGTGTAFLCTQELKPRILLAKSTQHLQTKIITLANILQPRRW